MHESKKAYRYRQGNLQKRYIPAQKIVQVIDQEVGIFKISQQANVEYQASAEKQPPFSRGRVFPAQGAGDQVVDQNGSQYQRQIVNAESTVEEQGTGRQPYLPALVPTLSVQQEVNHYGHRKKYKDKSIGVKRQLYLSFPETAKYKVDAELRRFIIKRTRNSRSFWEIRGIY